MIRFWWVRHGPTHEKAFCGWRDVPADLSDTAAIEWLNAVLPRPATLISSDLSRAVATADAVGEGRDRLPHNAELRELHFGQWEGLRFDEVEARDPDLSRAYWETPGDVAPPEGESWNTAAARVQDVVTSLMEAGPDRDIIIVAHFGVILTHLQHASGVSAAEILAQKIDNLSVSQTSWDGTAWQVGAINQIY